jgi:hypothetical protein
MGFTPLNPSRRSLMAALPAAALAVPFSTSPLSAAGHPDAELLTACARFIELSREVADAYDYSSEFSLAAEAAADAVAAVLHPKAEAALAEMTALRATTLSGVVARAATLATYNPDWAKSALTPADWIERQVRAVVRDLVAIGGAVPA